MARTTTITNQQILDAARTVFLEQGIGATAVDVANRAGISSGSIFKRYPTKEALFLAAMSEPPSRVWNAELEAAIGHGDTLGDLLRIARRIAEYTSEVVPRLMLLRSMGQMSELPEPPKVDDAFVALTTYLSREMALGRITRGDPTIPALALMHATAGFALSLRPSLLSRLADTNTFLEDFVGVLWRGLEPRSDG